MDYFFAAVASIRSATAVRVWSVCKYMYMGGGGGGACCSKASMLFFLFLFHAAVTRFFAVCFMSILGLIRRDQHAESTFIVRGGARKPIPFDTTRQLGATEPVFFFLSFF